jgi:hypothetical protein
MPQQSEDEKMNPAVSQLIPAIVSYVNEHGGYITKTKLLKLLYLFDVEYYRIHRRTFTGFSWKYFHLGPWAKEYEEALGNLIAQDNLLESESAKPEYDTKFYRTPQARDIEKVFPSLKDWAALKLVLDTWSESSTGEILDYVYFRTEPMEHGIRNEPLDFRTIQAEQPPKYSRTSSGKTTKEIESLRKKFREGVAGRVSGTRTAFTPPRYDEEFFEALSKLERTTD